MMNKPIALLREAGFSELACQFAAFIMRIDQSKNEYVALAAGLLSEAVSQGNVCLTLSSIKGVAQKKLANLPRDTQEWQSILNNSNVVGKAGDYTPLILTEAGQLYLYRHWQDEKYVAKKLLEISIPLADIDQQKLTSFFNNWSSTITEIDWQKVAVLMAMTQQFCVISGGPGTGKTTIVLRMLQYLQQQLDIRIALAAPTGKAAARLQQATQESAHTFEAKTLHRLLGITTDNEQGRYSPDEPLPVDVLIVDEASMVDISLMAKLLAALPEKARLILLGDSQQLASVESGAVLAHLCEQASNVSTEFSLLAAKFGIEGLGDHVREVDKLTDQIIVLQHSYRFDKDSLIGQLAQRVNQGDDDSAISLLTRQTQAIFFEPTVQNMLNSLLDGYQHYIDAVESRLPAKEIITAFDQFRVLAALKQGPQSVEGVNRLMAIHLAERGWRVSQNYFYGRPIMITQNDYRQHLFNGDVGIVLSDETDQLKVCFCFDDEIRWVPLNRLPAHETTFAMTVHKSQGSEFDNVSIVLPDEIGPLLSRELLYTAITRARKTLTILSNEASFRHTINTRHERESGLSEQLNKLVI